MSFSRHQLTAEFETSGDLIALTLGNSRVQKTYGQPLKSKEIELVQGFDLTGDLDEEQILVLLAAIGKMLGHLEHQIVNVSIPEMMTNLMADVNKATESIYKILKGKDLDAVISACLKLMRQVQGLFKLNPERCQIIETIMRAKLMYLRNFPGYSE